MSHSKTGTSNLSFIAAFAVACLLTLGLVGCDKGPLGQKKDDSNKQYLDAVRRTRQPLMQKLASRSDAVAKFNAVASNIEDIPTTGVAVEVVA